MKIRTLALCLLATAACRSSSPSNTPDAPNNTNPDTPMNGGTTSIYDIQDPSNKVIPGTIVNVHNVVVTAVDEYGTKTSNFWVEEPNGGPYSGVLVFKADNSVVMTLQPGDLVNIDGAEKAEFALSTDTSGRTTTELEPPQGGAIQVTKVGTGTVPAPEQVNALAIGQMASQQLQDAEWEKWEGVLITVNNVGVISSTKTFGSMPGIDSNQFVTTGPLTIESTLAAFPDTTMPGKGPQFGDCIGSITGVGDYFFSWLLEPRSTADIVTGGTGCPAAETTLALCQDGIDNDANGHADCTDYSCMLDAQAQSTCVTDSTIAHIDDGTTAVGAGVNLKGVFVTAIDSAKKNFWVADALAAAQNGGIQAFNLGTLPANMQVGSNVDIDLVVNLPFHGLPELGKIPGGTPTITVNTVNAGTPTALTTDLATLSDPTMVKPFLGSLVTIGKAKVTAVTGTGTKTIYTLSDGTKTIEMGVAIYAPVGVVAGTTCYASVTGIASLDTSPNPSVPMILPLGATALPPGTGCP